jgi:hypothetical protein
MKWKITNLQTRLYLIAALILLIGLGSSLMIYLTAEDDSNSVLGYEMAGGYVNPIMPEDSKKYMHDMELYGGKVNVVVNEFLRWFVGLWHGRSLAYTAACITIFISCAVFFVANHLPPDVISDARDESDRV